MELKGMVLPGYRVYEYLLILNPHEELRNRVTEARNEFNTEFKVEIGLGSKPNLALANFLQYEMMQERITARLKTIALGYPPFKVALKDFGSFPGHTIFINVVSKLGIQNLVRQVRSETQSLMKLNNETKPNFITEPHITIARKLKPWQYEKGWLKYSNKHFTGHFIADAMLLLKRPKGERSWQIAERFEFMNLPVSTRQGELF
jgi:2'-5' RNA ligase